MNWFGQQNSMMDAWVNAQQEMMKNWASMAEQAMQAQPNISNLWENTAQQTAQAWMQDATPTAQSVVNKFFDTQQAMMRLMNLSYETWQNLMPSLQGGGDWQAQLNDFMSTLRQQLVDVSRMGMTGQENMGQLWQSYLSEWQSIAAPWTTAMQQSATAMGRAATGDRSALLEMTNLYWDAYQETFGQLLQAPGLGYTREIEEKIRHEFAAWLEMHHASYRYQMVMADTWVKAFELLMTELMEQGAQEIPESMGLREFLNKWSGTADKIFKSAFASEEYIAVQSQLVNTMMEYRNRRRAIIDMMLEFYDMPTRSEVDEAHRRIYELRKAVKALKKEMATLRETPKTAKKSSTKKKSSSRKKKSASDK